ncbi:MAG: Ycf66 family protein [Synechocystis sp.]|nr:Ycf66 family protein [Synechocystis sp.]
MLALMLSSVVGSASLVFFFSAFFAPKLHRKDDFLWSGFGFFYALVLWICAQRFTGAILLGQLAGVCLILAFAWQTLRLRAAIAHQSIAEVPSFSLLDWVGGGLKRKPKAPKVQPETKETATKEVIQSTQSPPTVPPPVKEAAVAEDVVEKAVEKVDQVLEAVDTPPSVVETVEEIVKTAYREADLGKIAATEMPEPPTPTSVEPESPVPPTQPQGTATSKTAGDTLPKPKSKLFQWLFRGKKQQPPTPSTNVASVIESIDAEEDDWGDEDTVEEMVTAVEEVVDATIPPEADNVAAEEVIPSDAHESEDNERVMEDAQPVTASQVEALSAPSLEIHNEETVSPDITETVDSYDAEQANAGETIQEALETTASEPVSIAESLPIIPPSTTETDESSNWDDLEQEFDPYLGGDDASTTIEQKPQETSVNEGDQAASEITADAEVETKTDQIG